MAIKVGIRRENKNIWERRVPIIPDHLREMAARHGIEFIVQPSDIRVFSEKEYKGAGASVSEDLSQASIVFAVKEIPDSLFQRGKVYVFFAHVIKGQRHNMPMLKKLMELKCTLIDYEKIVDEKSRRLIFFGRHAGLAGMIDSLWAFGKRCDWEGIKTPFVRMKKAHEYHSLDEIREAMRGVKKDIASSGLPVMAGTEAGHYGPIVPLVCGFTGYGNVARGAQEIFDLLPVKEISPEELLEVKEGWGDPRVVYKVVFKEEDMAEPNDPSIKFELQDYYKHPEKYRGVFDKFVPHLAMLINCIYWDKRYPRLVTKDLLKRLYSGKGGARLKVIGDISCDVNGAIEATAKCTDPGNPVFVYDVDKDAALDGWEGNGPVILAVDNLPCEVARESSADFSLALEKFVPEIAKANYSVPFEELSLPKEIKNAVIVYQGELTPDYKYLEEYL